MTTKGFWEGDFPQTRAEFFEAMWRFTEASQNVTGVCVSPNMVFVPREMETVLHSWVDFEDGRRPAQLGGMWVVYNAPLFAMVWIPQTQVE